MHTYLKSDTIQTESFQDSKTASGIKKKIFLFKEHTRLNFLSGVKSNLVNSTSVMLQLQSMSILGQS